MVVIGLFVVFAVFAAFALGLQASRQRVEVEPEWLAHLRWELDHR